jgi:threonine dehydrogenase-like Zn-dependent dehydrogenase
MCARGRRDNCLTGAYVERGITGAHGYFRELAIDDARDLIVVPETLAEVAVLVEPASVVEKAWEVARTLHQGEPRTALILGAGTIGILAAWWAQRLGFETSVYALEPPHSARARLLTSHGVQYLPSFPAARFDIIMEACGDSAMAAASLSALAHCGVQIVLGARGANVAMPYLDLILRNQIIAGCVNASRAHFANAVVQLGRLHRRQLDPLIRRSGFHSIPESITHPSADVIKAVHVVSEG